MLLVNGHDSILHTSREDALGLARLIHDMSIICVWFTCAWSKLMIIWVECRPLVNVDDICCECTCQWSKLMLRWAALRTSGTTWSDIVAPALATAIRRASLSRSSWAVSGLSPTCNSTSASRRITRTTAISGFRTSSTSSSRTSGANATPSRWC